MIKNTIKLRGNLRVELLDKAGVVKTTKEINNLIVDAGLDWIAACLSDPTNQTAMSHMAIGADVTAQVAGNTALGDEQQRVALTVAGGSYDSPTKVLTYQASFGPSVLTNNLIVEAGIFNDATVGTMLARTTFGIITKAADDSMIVTWNIVLSAA